MCEPSDEDSAALEAGRLMFARPWQFRLGVVRLDQLPPADRPEVAFAGRSNVGKSSLLNALTGRRNLARTSNTPGRTQEINVFESEGIALRLIDMPGYGFAQAPKGKVDAWTALIHRYLQGRPNLRRVFLLIDSRHGLKAVDEQIMERLDKAAVSYQAVLTKIDKIATAAQADVLAATAARLAMHPAAFPTIIATSSQKGTGIDILRAEIAGIAG
ncbi:GTP-binding protein [Tepidamorphus gemmatus]|uniref:Probable GTP-binding protein EngB n=1 Tax=Tepidamorphus gemmatus TaxID=747076 RepID=A0A4R3M656_9HYPH|nr:GTP-binding protein [Tepidamorphus gemmatus]